MTAAPCNKKKTISTIESYDLYQCEIIITVVDLNKPITNQWYQVL